MRLAFGLFVVALGLAVFRPVELKADQPVEQAPILGR
jgi:hypothetical protein